MAQSKKIQDIIRELYLEVAGIDLAEPNNEQIVDERGFYPQAQSDTIWPLA